MILTTPGGLYRYDINDVVRVAGFYNRTPLIEFVRKGRDVTNITGEKLHVNQVIQAMAQAQSAAGVTLATISRLRRCGKIALRLRRGIGRRHARSRALSRMLLELDACLRKLNVEYAQKRESQRLAAPVLWVMRPGLVRAQNRRERAERRARRPVQSSLLSTLPEDPSEIQLIVQCADEPQP